MNKILIENDNISFDNEEVMAEINEQILNINIKNEVIINIYKGLEKLKELTINIKEKSSLKLNVYNNNTCNLKINIILEDKANILANMALISKEKSHLDIKTTMKGNDINNIIKINGISKNEGSYVIKVDGEVLKNTINNIMSESINILTLNKLENKILPNMLVSSKEVEAMHFVTMGPINEEELFYLTSKGIARKDAAKIIEKGFINQLFDQEFIKNLE